MSYNITWMNTSNTFVDIVIGINNNLSGALGHYIIIITFIFTFALTIRNGTPEALLASGLSSSVIGVLLLLAGVMSWSWVIVPIVILLAGVMFKAFGR